LPLLVCYRPPKRASAIIGIISGIIIFIIATIPHLKSEAATFDLLRAPRHMLQLVPPARFSAL
jgi:hypothetical protein